jgi:hypothetical protein
MIEFFMHTFLSKPSHSPIDRINKQFENKFIFLNLRQNKVSLNMRLVLS